MQVYLRGCSFFRQIQENVVTFHTGIFCKFKPVGRISGKRRCTHNKLCIRILLNKLLSNFVASLLFLRLAESYSQLVKHYLDNSVEVDKRLNWQVKEIVW